MIPNQHPYEAILRHHLEGEKEPYFEHLPIIAWDDDGTAMIIGRTGLERVTDNPNFQRLWLCRGKIVGVIPGGGYYSEYAWDNGTTSKYPVLAWVVDEDGGAHAIDVHSESAIVGGIQRGRAFRGVHLPEGSRDR